MNQSASRCRYCGSFYFFFQAEDGIRDLVRSRGLGDVYKRQLWTPEGSPLKVYGYKVEKMLQEEMGPEFKVVLALSLIHI